MTVDEIADFYNVPKKMLSAKENSFTFNQNSMSHSPAPWKAEEHDPFCDGWFAECDIMRNDGGLVGVINNKADAALIAAAPDLYAALKLAIDHDDMIREADPYYRIPDSVRVVIDAAISKANEINET